MKKRRQIDSTATRDEYLKITDSKNVESDFMGSLPVNRTVVFSCNQHEMVQCFRFLIKIPNFYVDRENSMHIQTKFSINLQEINEILSEPFEFFVIETNIKAIKEIEDNG